MSPGITVLPADVDHLRVLAGVPRDLRARARGDDTAMGDGEGFNGAERWIDRQNLAVRHDGIGRLLGQRTDGREDCQQSPDR